MGKASVMEQSNDKTGLVFEEENFVKGPECKAGKFKFYKMGHAWWQQVHV